MSDSAGGGGSVSVAGQDAEADNEPPQQALPLPEGDSLEAGETAEEAAPPSAKRAKMNEEEKELEQVDKSVNMYGETPTQTGFLQEDEAPPAQSRCLNKF